MELLQNKLFNPIIDTRCRLIGGKTNGIANLTKISYPWAKKSYDAMVSCFWQPIEVSLHDDSNQYKLLSEKEKQAFDKFLSFLIFLDSMVTSALPLIGMYITAPEVAIALAVHSFTEAVHTQSYAYVIESVIAPEKRDKIYELACTDQQMIKRNAYIAEFHQNFIDNPTDISFLEVIVAQYILESIYFTSGFCFFYNLAKFGKMTGTGKEIAFINRDELLHQGLFGNIFKQLKKENPELFTEEQNNKIVQMFKTATETEIAWFQYVCGDDIEGLTNKSIEAYIKNLCNEKIKVLGFKSLYPEFKKNPFPFIAQMSNPNITKQDFFEGKVMNYLKPSSKNKMDDLDNIEL